MTSEAAEREESGPSGELRRRSTARGIRDEPAPPILLTSRNVPGTLGLPECVRRAAFDERLYRLNGCPSPDDFIRCATFCYLSRMCLNCSLCPIVGGFVSLRTTRGEFVGL